MDDETTTVEPAGRLARTARATPGSASGGQPIALPLIAPHYIDQGVDPEALRANGVRVYRSGNGVLLARRVPAACIAALEVASERAKPREATLRASFGLPSLT